MTVPNRADHPNRKAQPKSVSEMTTSSEGLKAHHDWIKANPGKAAKLNLTPSGEHRSDWKNPGGSAGPYVPQSRY
jgi:hypothetical protein